MPAILRRGIICRSWADVACTGQTISLIMRKLLIAISNSATISSEGLIVQLLGVLIADVLIMDPHNAHLAISRFMPHASRRAPA